MLGKEKYTLSNLIDKNLYRMSNIWRYSGRTILRPENIAEHSFYVTYKVHEIGHKYHLDESRINKAARIALCHDIAETETGDFPHSLKVYSEDIKNMSEELELKVIKDSFNLFYEDFKDFIEETDPVVCSLVRLADITDVIMFIDREETLGNRDPEILEIKTESYERYFNEIKLFEEALKNEETK